MRHVLHIFGASGSGTSTLGKKISEELGYRWMDTDDYYWLPTDPKYLQARPVQERLRRMKHDILHSEQVVISGSLVDWGDALIPLFTLAIRLETDTSIRMVRLEQREKAAFGSRIEKGGDLYQAHLRFMAWAKQYDDGGLDMRSKAKHDEWQKLLRCKLIRLDGSRELNENYMLVQHVLQTDGGTIE